ncbi:hypothetical protein [Tichowtungia aerotolerans]|uniref:Uncharacterized protein n=1 Tax=Tichowtungia aerotolerans TaxID=2697043 RepID=A0A6P1M2L5_9BACT|nr:hypothetical protein [Tichowtungia aerotolerans]QHI68091.1 hypothetical protein GT409_01025 [Tichowtungia aerotolerans]
MISMKMDYISRPTYRAVFGLIGRIFVYAVLLGVIAAGMLWGAVEYGPVFYDEIGPVETLETVFAMSTALVLLWVGRSNERCAPCAVMLSGFLFCVAVRESDYFLDVLVCRHAWKMLVLLLLAVFTVYLIRNMRRVFESVAEFMQQPAFGVFMSGLLVLIVFSRLFGYGGFWKELIEDDHYRVIKTIVEEGVELMGYFLILVSSLEYRHAALDEAS